MPRVPRGSSDTQVLVLGGGISGCLVAAGLFDKGYKPTIVEQRETLMDGSSGWNDGKIHLGYTFTGTTSLATAALMQRGAASFVRQVEHLTGGSLDPTWFGDPTIYVVDRMSLFDVGLLWDRAQTIARLLVESAHTIPGLERYIPKSGHAIERLDVQRTVSQSGFDDIVGAWRTTEVHVSARQLAPLIRRAVEQRAIPISRGQVVGVSRSGDGWRVQLAGGDRIRSEAVVNCLWENRVAIDRTVDSSHHDDTRISIRHKRSVFGFGTALSGGPSVTRLLGPFGDVATYGNGESYMSTRQG